MITMLPMEMARACQPQNFAIPIFSDGFCFAFMIVIPPFPTIMGLLR